MSVEIRTDLMLCTIQATGRAHDVPDELHNAQFKIAFLVIGGMTA